MSSANDDDTETGYSWLIGRRPHTLQELEPDHRWEVTRRHPVYIELWDYANALESDPSGEDGSADVALWISICLLAIGVADQSLPAPRQTAEELRDKGQLSTIWQQGAIAPITFGGLLTILLANLPTDALREASELLNRASGVPFDSPENQLNVVLESTKLRHPAFRLFSTRPVIGLNVHAPIRIVEESVANYLRKKKEELGIPEKRRRPEKIDEYLEVWDLREGWLDGEYLVQRETTLHQIAKQLRIPVSTVENRYRSAFRLIIGKEFSTEIWLRAFWFFKHLRISGEKIISSWGARRSQAIRAPRPVSQARLGYPISQYISDLHDESIQLAKRIISLIALDRTDAEIVEELDLEHPEIVHALRDRDWQNQVTSSD